MKTTFSHPVSPAVAAALREIAQQKRVPTPAMSTRPGSLSAVQIEVNRQLGIDEAMFLALYRKGMDEQ